MPLEPVPQMMKRAMAGGYAVGYFESWSIDSLQGAIDAAEQVRAPTIIGFNGELLSRRGRVTPECIEWYGALGVAAARSATVPCGLIFNECSNDDSIRAAVAAGFNLVMPADPEAPFDDYTRRVSELTRLAHEHQVAVEAEVGELPSGLTAAANHPVSATDPDVIARFVDQTGVDLLAVSVGNFHVMVEGSRSLDLDLLSALREKVSVPFVLHGGTGIAADSLRQAIALGVTKVNFGTYIKQRYLKAIRLALQNDQTDPHKLIGYGGNEDILVVGRRAVREAILERMDWLGCCGKA